MKNKIVWKFLGYYIPLILFAVIVLNFFVSFSLREHFEAKILKRLDSNSMLVGRIIQEDLLRNDFTEIQKDIDQLSDQLGERITIVGIDGVVLADSDENPKVMDNHGTRSEVLEALQKDKGKSKRFSDTLSYNMQYFASAVKVEGKTFCLVRLALPLKEVDAQIRVIYRAVLFGGVLAALFTIIIGYFISKSITNPISEMREIAQKISNGDLSRKVKIRSNDELGALAEALNHMAEQLQNKIENLKKMDKVRTDFVANVSHELKTPLTSIKGYIETLEDGAIDDKDNAKRFIGIIKKHSESLNNIVNDLLTLSEVELGKDKLYKSRFDLKVLLDEVVLGFGHAIKLKKQKIDFIEEGAGFQIDADRGKIEQVFVNLIDNAVKYSKEAGSVKVFLLEKDNDFLVSIEDKGMGIPRKDMDRIFERFYRVNKARSKELGGTGLGLSIVKHIVSLHNGKIDVSSEINKGTKVSVLLPKV